MTSLTLSLLIAATLGSGMMAGLFCSFSSFIMQALSEIPHSSGIASMQAINRVIVKPSFLLAFWGTGLANLLAVGFGWQQLSNTALIWSIAGWVVYVTGILLVTIAFNIPLNNKLESVDPESMAGSKVWESYLIIWVRWNHVRSIATIVSTLCLIIAVLYANSHT
jgi:uncharacterized membrane protein